jgi:hypothetical protein
MRLYHRARNDGMSLRDAKMIDHVIDHVIHHVMNDAAQARWPYTFGFAASRKIAVASV